MCGIIAGLSKTKRDINKPLWKRYNHQKARGQEGFGFAAVVDGKLIIERDVAEKGIHDKLFSALSKFVMFHHRYPTSTANLEEATHPIVVSHSELDYDYLVVHNGVISNEDDMKKKHDALGYEYNTTIIERSITEYETANGQVYEVPVMETVKFNDSEAFAIDLARVLDGQTAEMESKGSIAFIALRVSKETGKIVKMFFGRNYGNPLCIEENNDILFIKSVGGKEIEADTLFEIDMETGERLQRPFKVGWYAYKPSAGFELYQPHRSVYYDDNYKDYHGASNTITRNPLDDDDPLLIESPYSVLSDKEEIAAKAMVREYLTLEEEMFAWRDLKNAADRERKNSIDLTQKDIHYNDMISAEENEKEAETKMREVESRFYSRFGGGIDFYDLVSEYLDETSGELLKDNIAF